MYIKSSICGIQHTCINFLIFRIITKIECWPVFKQEPLKGICTHFFVDIEVGEFILDDHANDAQHAHDEGVVGYPLPLLEQGRPPAQPVPHIGLGSGRVVVGGALGNGDPLIVIPGAVGLHPDQRYPGLLLAKRTRLPHGSSSPSGS